jgi:hypothetical protein
MRLWIFACLLICGVAQADTLQVPGDVEELTRACSGVRGLETFGQNGYLGIECGYQAVLLGSRLPVAPAAHVPWAVPYARGPIKLLIITTFGNATADVEELAHVTRELDVDVRWLLVADMAVTHENEADDRYRTVFLPEQARAVLREDFDAIVLTFGTNTPGHGNPRAHPYLPDDIFRLILDKVRAGTGLVVTGQDTAGYWVDESPLAAALPARMKRGHTALDAEHIRITGPLFRGLDARPTWFSQEKPLAVYHWKLRPDAQLLAEVDGKALAMTRTHGAGRIVLLGWDGTLGPWRTSGRTQLEHSTALSLRAIAFAAKKEPLVQLTLAPNVQHVTISAPAQLELSLRDATFRVLHVIKAPLRAGDNAIALPPLFNGEYFAQAIARDAHGRVLAWADQTLSVAAAAQLTVSTEREVYAVGDTVRIHARTSATLDGTATLSVRDAAGRVLARQTRAFAPELQFEYPIAAARVAPHRVELEVTRGQTPLLRGDAAFYVPASRWDDYQNVLWPMSRTAPTSRQLRDQAGFTALLDGDGSEQVSSFAAHYGQQAARLNDGILAPALVQTAPLKAAAPKATFERSLDAARRFGALFWLLQDERHQVTDAGPPDAEGLRRFRAYLRKQYGSVAALNAAWGTRYASWDAIDPTLTEAVHKGVKNLAPWVDFRLYVADQAYEIDAQRARAVRGALGEDTLVGLDGFTTSGHMLPYAAVDYGRLTSEGALNFYAPYSDDFVFSSFLRGPKAKYLGWSMSRAEYFGFPWRDAFRGFWGSLRFFGPTFASELGFLLPAGRWTGEGTRELREGVGKLLIGSERELSPVAILYSYASLIVGSGARYWEARHGGAELNEAAAESRSVIEQALGAAGVSFGYQTEAQLLHGGLANKQLLIVPRQMGLALSAAAVRVIEQFVQRGGTLLADLTPALCDEHGRPRASGALDGLFGVHTGAESIVHTERDFRAGVLREHALLPSGEWLLDEWYDKRLRVTDGRAQGAHVLDDTPAFVVKQTGRGRALLLNTLLSSRLPTPISAGPEQHALMRTLLAAIGVEPHARVEAESGEPETHCEVNRFRDGANHYVGFYAHAEPDAEPDRVRARFDDELHTYDVRAGRYLGRVREVPLPLHEKEAALFARLDYVLQALTLEVPASMKRGAPLRLALALEATGAPGRHVVHIALSGPQGVPLPLYTENAVLEHGRAELQVATALNDPAGTWNITAREVVSGLSVTRSVEVQ